MKFSCDQFDFNAALALASRAVPARPSHQILNCIKLEATDGRIWLVASDLGMEIRASFAAEISEGGVAALPAKILADIVARCPRGELQFAGISGREKAISGDTNREFSPAEEPRFMGILGIPTGEFQIQGMNPAQFPEWVSDDSSSSKIKIPVAALLEGLRGALFAVSADKTKQVLTGVHLTGTQDSLEFAATDGHRLAVVKTPLENSETTIADFSMTIPARALRELERMLAGCQENDSISLHVSDSQVIFELDSLRLTSRKLEGAYPAYRQLIPSKFICSTNIVRKQLLSAVERVAVLSDKNGVVKFKLEANELELSMSTPDFGSANEILPVENMGYDSEISFNIQYVIDGLKNSSSDNIQLNFNGPQQSAIFTEIKHETRVIYLIMPIFRV